jgi:hypothetical protein
MTVVRSLYQDFKAIQTGSIEVSSQMGGVTNITMNDVFNNQILEG